MQDLLDRVQLMTDRQLSALAREAMHVYNSMIEGHSYSLPLAFIDCYSDPHYAPTLEYAYELKDHPDDALRNLRTLAAVCDQLIFEREEQLVMMHISAFSLS